MNYIVNRNRRIAMRRTLITLGLMLAIWGIVIWTVL